MNGVELNYYNSVTLQLDDLQKKINNMKIEIDNIYYIKPNYSESTLESCDIAIIFIAGVLGGVFSSSKQIEEYFHKIHDGSSKPKRLIEKLLHHAGDEIDKGGKYITRNGDGAALSFHRLFFGHDILSVKGDNPIFLLISQYGLLKGPLQVVRHLLADTLSKQGLPLPGHSFLDFTKSNGRTGNYLIELTKHLSKGADVNNVQAFNHLFSIRMADAISQGLTWAICTAYINFKGIADEIKISQIKLSAYSVSFFTNAICGMIRTGGLPYVNWITLGMMIKEFYKFIKANYHEIKILENTTENLVKSNIELEKRVFETGSNIKTYNNANEFINDINRTSDIFDDITNFFEEV